MFGLCSDLTGNILYKIATHCNVDKLHAPTDSENGTMGLARSIKQFKFQGITHQSRFLAVLGMFTFKVLWGNILTACK